MKNKSLITSAILFILIMVFWTNDYAQDGTAINSAQGLVYLHSTKISSKAKVVNFVMPFMGYKKAIEKAIAKNQFKHEAVPPPASLTEKYNVTEAIYDGRKVWTIAPKTNASPKLIYYIHGGAYIANMSKFHWNIIADIAQKTNATLVVPDYPLAPDTTYQAAYTFVEAIYNQILSKNAPENIIFMGDSAGAGLALGFAQKLSKEHKPQPNQIILLSPWLDISMSNPDIEKADKDDKMLGVKGLQMAGVLYAGALDTKDYQVSPIYGNLQGLGKISVFIGTHDVFIPDARKFKQLMNEQKIPFNYYEYPKMFHVWVALPQLAEAQYALNQIAGLIKGDK
jgi:acetyl esterase/lipase